MKHLKQFALFEKNTEEKPESNESFENWKKALALYDKKEGVTASQERELVRMFKGSKITSRFIVRSISKPTLSLYEKDCKDFGKAKVDKVANDVLDIFK